MKRLLKPFDFMRQTGIPYVKENVKVIARYIFTLFFVGLGLWFIRHEETELHQVKHILATSSWEWLIAGILLAIVYILLQGLMYVESFAAIGSRISLNSATVLFLKRNFVSVFLPGFFHRSVGK
jgi:phosphatidylglycerol lysyltransferase